jgi:hypothetical protein
MHGFGVVFQFVCDARKCHVGAHSWPSDCAGGVALDWIFGPLTGDVHYHENRRFLAFLIASSLFYASLIFFIPIAVRSLSSTMSEKRKAKGE